MAADTDVWIVWKSSVDDRSRSDVEQTGAVWLVWLGLAALVGVMITGIIERLLLRHLLDDVVAVDRFGQHRGVGSDLLSEEPGEHPHPGG